VRQELLPPLTGGLIGGGKGAGKPAPQPWVQTKLGHARLDDVTARGWRVLLSQECVADDRLVAAAHAFGAAIIRIGPPHSDEQSSFDERDGVFRNWLKDHDANAIIIRPDHVVYTSVADADAIRTALSELARSGVEGAHRRDH
jgi:3-(3-hydroxy-phenyl)propionate hydroxylase